jgi:predicted membrane channel-forming protein YqfA (hemolysin III family)
MLCSLWVLSVFGVLFSLLYFGRWRLYGNLACFLLLGCLNPKP